MHEKIKWLTCEEKLGKGVRRLLIKGVKTN